MSLPPLDPAANQPQWLPWCLREIEGKLSFLTSWEAYFIRRMRPKIQQGLKLNDWEQNKLSQVRNQVVTRKKKPVERKQFRPVKKKPKEFYV